MGHYGYFFKNPRILLHEVYTEIGLKKKKKEEMSPQNFSRIRIKDFMLKHPKSES